MAVLYSARETLVRGTVRAQELGGEVEGQYPPLACEVKVLVVEQPDGSYIMDVVMSRCHYAPESGEVFLGEQGGKDGLTGPGETGSGIRSIEQAVEFATGEIYPAMF